MINQSLTQQNNVGRTDGHFRVQSASSLHGDIQSLLFLLWAVSRRTTSPESQLEEEQQLKKSANWAPRGPGAPSSGEGFVVTDADAVSLAACDAKIIWALREAAVSVFNNGGEVNPTFVAFHFLTFPNIMRTLSRKHTPDGVCLWAQTGQNWSTDGQTCFRLHLMKWKYMHLPETVLF